LTLEKCTVVYDGTIDQAKTGYKPIAIMVEDVDENGAIRSSVPVQFLAEVWTPQPTKNSIGRIGGVENFWQIFEQLSLSALSSSNFQLSFSVHAIRKFTDILNRTSVFSTTKTAMTTTTTMMTITRSNTREKDEQLKPVGH